MAKLAPGERLCNFKKCERMNIKSATISAIFAKKISIIYACISKLVMMDTDKKTLYTRTFQVGAVLC